MKFLDGAMLLTDIENLGMPFEIKLDTQYYQDRMRRAHQKAVEDGKELSWYPLLLFVITEINERSVLKVRELWGSKTVLNVRSAESDDAPELMDPERGAIIEQ